MKHGKGSYPTSRWMEELAKSSPEVKLRNLIMLSSHDAATSSIPGHICCSSVSRTQTFNLHQQLKVGVRHLDTRFAPCKKRNQLDALSVQHGTHSGGDYFDALEEVLVFIETHPKEFIFLDCTFEAKSKVPLLSGHVEHLVNFLQTKFGQYAIQQEDLDSWFKIDQVMIHQLVSSKKRILIMVDHGLLGVTQDQGKTLTADELAKKGLFLNEDFRHSQWHNAGDPQTLFRRNSEFMAAGEIDKSRLLINQLILTPQTKTKHVIQYLLGLDSVRVDQKQQALLKKRQLQRHVRSLAANMDTNVIMLDFLDYDPNLLKFIIGLNLPHKLKVLKGSYQPLSDKKHHLGIDITERLNRLIVRGSSLWILDLETDLGIEAGSGWLNLSLEFDGTEIVLQRLKVVKGMQYLFNGLVMRDMTVNPSDTLEITKPSFEIDLDPVRLLTTRSDENPLMPVMTASYFEASQV